MMARAVIVKDHNEELSVIKISTSHQYNLFKHPANVFCPKNVFCFYVWCKL